VLATAGTCNNGECEGLHEIEDVREQQKSFPVPHQGIVIIAAGTCEYIAVITAVTYSVSPL
jgi:hypothetical protein